MKTSWNLLLGWSGLRVPVASQPLSVAKAVCPKIYPNHYEAGGSWNLLGVFFDIEVSISHRDKAAVNNSSPGAVIYKPCTLNSSQVFRQEVCQSHLCIFKIFGGTQQPQTVVSLYAEHHKTLVPGGVRRGGGGVAWEQITRTRVHFVLSRGSYSAVSAALGSLLGLSSIASTDCFSGSCYKYIHAMP